jgi:hypothetical protein
MMCSGEALALVQALKQRRVAQAAASTAAAKASAMWIAFLVSSFMGKTLPQSFKLSPGCLARPGFSHRHRRHRSNKTYGAPRAAAIKEEWAYRGIQAHGRMAAVLWPQHLFGRLVYVETSQAELDASAVSASVDSLPYFSRDGPYSGVRRNTNAWHAVKVHNFCRPMGASEACCERVGSLMQNNWDKVKGEDAGALMDSVLLQEARVSGIGNPRDELICQEVAAAFLTLGRNPAMPGRRASKPGDSTSTVLARVRTADQAHLAESGRGSMGNPVAMLFQDRNYEADVLPAGANAVLTRGLIPRNLGEARAERRRRATPALKTSTAVQQALQSAKSGEGVAALPMFWQDPRREHGQAGSVRKEKLSHWLRSAEGRQWLQEKQQRWEDAA